MQLVCALADPQQRPRAARILAEALAAREALVLIRDHDLGVLRPAPGFVQTLPGGPTWRSLLECCEHSRECTGEVAFPAPGTFVSYRALAAHDGSVLLLLGGNPVLRADELEPAGFPLLSALLRAESVATASSGLAVAAREASAQAQALAQSLDLARLELAAKTRELAEALHAADKLNFELRRLNETLEQRVSERTQALEQEVEMRQKAEVSLVQAQKMEAIGQLTGGVAHDFNNLLTVIMGNLELVRRTATPDQSRVLRSTENAFQAAQRAASLTHRLLAFSRRQPLSPKPTDANRLVSDMTALLHRTLGERVELEGVLASRLWAVEVDQNQLENALINLAVNARDAMPDGGKLTIETANVVLDETYAATAAEVNPGQYIAISVSDTGHGMSKEIMEKVFEPFFTTKAVGKGTGLGLSQVYGFIRQSEGHVRIYSEPGNGTTARIYLPRYHGSVDAEADARVTQPLPRGNGETVLVVEDEDAVRAHSTEVLRDLGYHVLEARSGEEALARYGDAKGIDLLFTDVVLPGISGRQLAEKMAMKPGGPKVLYTTGYAPNAIIHHGRLNVGTHLIPKPFTYEQLAEKIWTTLIR